LEIYLKKIQDFVYGSPTSIETSSQDEEAKAGPVGQFKKRKCGLKRHRNLEEGAKKKKNHKQLGTKIGGDYSKFEVEQSKMKFLEIEPHIELVEEEIKFAN
jgi:hypothetical protein